MRVQRRRILQHMKRFNRRPSRSLRNSVSIKVEGSEGVPPAVAGSPGANADDAALHAAAAHRPTVATMYQSPFAVGMYRLSSGHLCLLMALGPGQETFTYHDHQHLL